jgi:two-component system response regulator AtoC
VDPLPPASWSAYRRPEPAAAEPRASERRGPGAGLARQRTSVPDLVGSSPCVAELRRMIDLVAPTATTILITGETGTGKEVIARRVHGGSPRAERPFVAVNCAALPENLIESELFGYERGAFTGAAGSRAGYFEEAHTGTLFLDEVADLPLALQPKLLRALQQREVRRLGATRSVPVDVRVIAATNGDVARAVADGRLRPDLYYRLRVIELHLPPLRERKEDIPALCEHFVAVHQAEAGSPPRRASPAALTAMDAYTWPGNVRELENVVERALVLARLDAGDALLPCHLPEELVPGDGVSVAVPPPARALDLAGAVGRVRRHYLAEALRLSGGNKVVAARLLGISRRGLYDLMAEQGAAGRPAR